MKRLGVFCIALAISVILGFSGALWYGVKYHTKLLNAEIEALREMNADILATYQRIKVAEREIGAVQTNLELARLGRK
jgi:uncharacterized protein HemX